MYDAIVVGARCAGAATAMLLARRGYRVLLLERGSIPSEIPHGHLIHQRGPAILQRWGLLEKIVATGCPPLTTHLTDFGDFPLIARDVQRDGLAWGYGPRRGALDAVLVDAAIAAGAEFRQNFLVEEYLSEDDRITGIRGRDKEKHHSVTEKARITIGADGLHSLLARMVGAAKYEEVPPLTCWYFSYWSGVSTEGFEMYVRQRRVIFSLSTNDNLFGVFIAWSIDQFESVRADIEGNFLRVLDEVPDFAERVRSGRREERFYGTADLPNFLRCPQGPGWALIGDAGCHKDPYLALGICDAFRDAELLAAAVHEGLSGERALDESLADYERRRNEATLPEYRENIERAKLEPISPNLAQLRLALRDREDDARKFVMAREGMIPQEDFFNRQNLQRVLEGSAA
jgi:2-polyprenyl-6-methoxyphenol hydroxylase-like FAD-dependent oxidoreductase